MENKIEYGKQKNFLRKNEKKTHTKTNKKIVELIFPLFFIKATLRKIIKIFYRLVKFLTSKKLRKQKKIIQFFEF